MRRGESWSGFCCVDAYNRPSSQTMERRGDSRVDRRSNFGLKHTNVHIISNLNLILSKFIHDVLHHPTEWFMHDAFMTFVVRKMSAPPSDYRNVGAPRPPTVVTSGLHAVTTIEVLL